MKETVLITGATGGIGSELASKFAEHGFDIVLTARNRDRLEGMAEEIRSKYSIGVLYFVADLSSPDGAASLYRSISDAGTRIDILVNNAGFGDYGLFTDRSWDKYEGIIALNVTALTRLTHLFASDMAVRGNGKIMNIASAVAFQPGPYWSVYSASKAYVLSLTEALAEEYRGRGITFTALCPGPTMTGFENAAESSKSRMFSTIGAYSPSFVADRAFKGLMAGKTVVIPGIKMKILVLLSKIAPRAAVRRFYSNLQ